jgi:hypothetical protein
VARPGQHPNSVKNRFQPGVSGNPNGRSPIIDNLRDRAREHCGEAIETLVAALRSAPWPARIVAANSLLARGYGLPLASVDLNLIPSGPPEPSNREDDMRVAAVKYEASLRHGFFDDSGADGPLLIEHQTLEDGS